MGDGESDAESEHGVRITAICLRRRPDRWAACEEHLLCVCPEHLLPCFDMFAGTDAKAAARGESPIDALEARTGCRVYRGWPIQEVSDVRRCYPQLAELPETQAWLEYERCFSRAWRRDRARLYVDFFCRHLTLGDVGAALSHLRVAERAHAEGLQLQVDLPRYSLLLAPSCLLLAPGSSLRLPAHRLPLLHPSLLHPAPLLLRSSCSRTTPRYCPMLSPHCCARCGYSRPPRCVRVRTHTCYMHIHMHTVRWELLHPLRSNPWLLVQLGMHPATTRHVHVHVACACACAMCMCMCMCICMCICICMCMHPECACTLHVPCICKVRWDLIYLGGSAQYCRDAEPAVDAPGSCLRVAGHRKARTTCTCTSCACACACAARTLTRMHRAAALALGLH